MILAKKFFAIPALAMLMLLGLAGSASAIDLDTGLEEVGGAAEIDTSTTLEETIGTIINVFLGFLGIIFLILTIYAGFLWMTAGGNADKVDKAKKILVQAVIGLIILLAAYAITSFVVGELGAATGN